MTKLSIVGGGLSGLVAITAAERGTEVELFEARKSLSEVAFSSAVKAAEKASALLRSQPTSRAAAPAGRA